MLDSWRLSRKVEALEERAVAHPASAIAETVKLLQEGHVFRHGRYAGAPRFEKYEASNRLMMLIKNTQAQAPGAALMAAADLLSLNRSLTDESWNVLVDVLAAADDAEKKFKALNKTLRTIQHPWSAERMGQLLSIFRQGLEEDPASTLKAVPDAFNAIESHFQPVLSQYKYNGLEITDQSLPPELSAFAAIIAEGAKVAPAEAAWAAGRIMEKARELSPSLTKTLSDVIGDALVHDDPGARAQAAWMAAGILEQAYSLKPDPAGLAVGVRGEAVGKLRDAFRHAIESGRLQGDELRHVPGSFLRAVTAITRDFQWTTAKKGSVAEGPLPG